MTRIDVRWMAALVVMLLAVPALAFGQTDEIQVYDGSMAVVEIGFLPANSMVQSTNRFVRFP